VTDGCINWEESVAVLEGLAAAVKQRRLLNSNPA
jgi:3-deoxy-7-phosphoheptulonate synthase